MTLPIVAVAGTVYLVGAGPGDPGLITVRGFALIKSADAIVYDRLIPQELIEEARPEAERHYVGRARGSQVMDQPSLNALLVSLAQANKSVVRLKGGDPFVFGRGGEEAEACAVAGVPYVIVPGITSAIAVPAYAGIPLTHRAVASSFAVVTGHDAQSPTSSVDWERLATGVDTLVVLMGVAELPAIVGQLLQHGRSPSTPVALISQGTRATQRVLVATLAEVEHAASEQRIDPPAIFLVGEVVRLQSTLAWFGDRPGTD